MQLAILHEVVGCYLILTLAATGLAKARAWRTAALAVGRERVIPRSLALPVTVGLCTVEITLAVLLASRTIMKLVGLATAALFLAFACYKSAVVIKIGKDACSCTGTSTMFKATRPSVLASLVSSLVQAACGILWAFGPPGTGMWFSLVTVVALAVPLAALLAGSVGASRKGRTTGQSVRA
jgi:hypothetical protein